MKNLLLVAVFAFGLMACSGGEKVSPEIKKLGVYVGVSLAIKEQDDLADKQKLADGIYRVSSKAKLYFADKELPLAEIKRRIEAEIPWEEMEPGMQIAVRGLFDMVSVALEQEIAEKIAELENRDVTAADGREARSIVDEVSFRGERLMQWLMEAARVSGYMTQA